MLSYGYILRNINNRSAIASIDDVTAEQCIELVEESYGHWCNPSIDVDNVNAWIAQKFSVDIHDDTFQFAQLEQAYKDNCLVMRYIYSLTIDSGLIPRSGEMNEGGQVKEKINKAYIVCKEMYTALRTVAIALHRIDEERSQNLASLPDVISAGTIIDHDKSKNTTFQNLMEYVLSLLQTAELRRLENTCYKQIITKEGHHSHAWEVYNKDQSSIRHFIAQNVTKETDYEQWRNLTNPRDNGEKIAEHLALYPQVEFPVLQINRHLFAYSNGLYNFIQDMFYPFEVEVTDEYGDAVYESGQRHWPQMAADITEFRQRIGWKDYEATAPTDEDVAAKYFDQPFRFSITPEDEETFDVNEIRIPEIELLLDTQELTAETKRWVLIMLARLFYAVGELDGWEVMLFIKGVAGSGKSTLAKLVRHCFQADSITTLSSNIEKKFGLSGIYKGLICICAEVREDFGLEQSDWQSAVSGEEVPVAVKHGTAFAHKWVTPFFFLGNVYPGYNDAGGSVARRMFMIEFNKKVVNSDPHLFRKVIENIDYFMRKSNVLYLEAVRLHADKSLWKHGILPEQVWEFHNNMVANTSSIAGFLQSGAFEFGDDHEQFYMPFKTFQNNFTEYVRSINGIPPRFNRDLYLHPLQEHGVRIETLTRTFGGEEHSGKFLVGIRPVDAMTLG